VPAPLTRVLGRPLIHVNAGGHAAAQHRFHLHFRREDAMTKRPDALLLDTLGASRLGADLTPPQLERLAGLVRLQTLATREVLAREGSTDNLLYVVVSGTLAVVKNLDTPEEAQLVTLGAGDFAHELGFLDGAVRYASLVATAPTRVLVLEREQLETLIDTDPRLLYRVMCTIVRAVHAVQTRLSVQASELTNYIVKQHGRY
jgi:CRP-like cAMP-binding protein